MLEETCPLNINVGHDLLVLLLSLLRGCSLSFMREMIEGLMFDFDWLSPNMKYCLCLVTNTEWTHTISCRLCSSQDWVPSSSQEKEGDLFQR